MKHLKSKKSISILVTVVLCLILVFYQVSTVFAEPISWDRYIDMGGINNTIYSTEETTMNTYSDSYTKLLPADGETPVFGPNNSYTDWTIDVPTQSMSKWYISGYGPFLDYATNHIGTAESDSITWNDYNNTWNNANYAYIGSNQADLSELKSVAMMNYTSNTLLPTLVNSSTTSLDLSITNEVDSHNVKNLVVLGGSQRLSDMFAIGGKYNIVRIGGTDRNDTYNLLNTVESSPSIKSSLYTPTQPTTDSNGEICDLEDLNLIPLESKIQGYLDSGDFNDAAITVLGVKQGTATDLSNFSAIIGCKGQFLKVNFVNEVYGYPYGVYQYIGPQYFASTQPSQSVTINYIDQNTGNQITNPYVDNNPKIGANTYTAPTLSGYTLVGNNTVTVNVQVGQSYTENFYYTENLGPINDTYNFTCYDEKTNAVIDDSIKGTVNVGSWVTVNSPNIAGYTLDTSRSPSVTYVYGPDPAGTVLNYKLYYKMNPTPPTIWWTQAPPINSVHEGDSYNISVTGVDPQQDNLTYIWSISDGQSILGNGGTLTAGSPGTETITVYAIDTDGLQSNTLTATVQIFNNPPTIILNLPQTALIGDNIPVTAYIYDQDLDTISTLWYLPSSMKGGPIDNVANYSGVDDINTSVYFNSASDANKTYNFTVTATDQWGATSTQTASITILPVYPTATLALTGTQKENRLETLTASNISGGNSSTNVTGYQYQFYDSNNNLLTVDSVPTPSNVVKSDEVLTNSSLDFLIKKSGTYTAVLTLTNSFGLTGTVSQTINVAQDQIPLANLYMIAGDRNAKDPRYAPNGIYASYPNPNNTDAQGHALYTRNLYDNNNVNSDGYTTDGDIIAHRIWIRCWDSTNSNTYYARDAEVYSSGKWQSLSNFINFDSQATLHDVIPLLDISKIDDGNCTSVVSQVPWVGGWYYYLITQEAYGQPTIPQLITNADYRISDRTDVIK